MNRKASGMAITSRTIAILLAVLLVAVLSIAGTRSVFTDTTDNTANSFTSGAISLVDDDSGTVMFQVVDMLPGDTVNHCIAVSYEGPNARATNGVEIYVPSYTDSAALADDLIVTIDEGASPGVGFDPSGTRTGVNDAQGDCTGFVSSSTIVNGLALSAAGFPTSYLTGTGTWAPTGLGTGTPVTLTYRISVTLDSASTAEGDSVTAIPFTWEVQVGS